jgi:hypothetical protein
MSIKTSLNIFTSGHTAAIARGGNSRRAPLMLGLLAFATLVSSAVTAATLDDVSYTSLPGDRVQVKMKLSAPVEGAPLSFTIDNPARIAIDLLRTFLEPQGTYAAHRCRQRRKRHGR